MPISYGNNCKIGKIKIKNTNADIKIGNNCVIEDNVTIDVGDRLEIGDRTFIGHDSEISGRNIELGIESYLCDHIFIGGGSCKGKYSQLKTGYWFHLGRHASINTARKVEVGNQVGIGQNSALFTHGAYLNYLKGFPAEFAPITIESNVWLPQATVLPNVKIDKNVVVAAGSVVNRDIPENFLAGGIPARLIKKLDIFNINDPERFNIFYHSFLDECGVDGVTPFEKFDDTYKIYIDGTLFDFEAMRMDGKVTEWTEKFKDYARRWGIRFRYFKNELGIYEKW